MNDMAFFFFFDKQQPIGIKLLSRADLGLSVTSHQTHIGLYQDILQYLGNQVVTSAMFIYEKQCEILDCYFDRIENPDGSFRSPKIRVGDRDRSVAGKIRHITSERPQSTWFLVWSALDNGNLVFWLIEESSSDYSFIKDLTNAGANILYDTDSSYDDLRNVLIKRTNDLSLPIQKDIEIAAQTGITRKGYKRIDLEKALRRLTETGKRGETLVNEYLKKLSHKQSIKSFEWLNKSRELGLPYDFIINISSDLNMYIDVKSTAYDFSQRIIFSNHEIRFVKHSCNDDNYSVYRVFDMDDKGASLRICRQCLPYMNNMEQNINYFTTALKHNETLLMNMSLAVEPAKCFSVIDPIISI